MGWLNNWNWSATSDDLLDALFRNKNTSAGWKNSEENINKIKEIINKYGFSESQVKSILESYKPDSIFETTDLPKQLLADLQEMNSWSQYIGDAPELPNPEDYYKEAEEVISGENRQLSDLYDSILNRETESLTKELNENNAMFSDYRNQLLTNDMINQQALAGSTRFELDRQQRNAISRGASAAQRLVANINAQLGTQAQSAQQSLETSNALAQQLLAHRQANAGLRSNYINALNSDAERRAGMIQGNSERVLNYQNNKLGQAMDAYDINKERYNERLSNIQGTNPWSSAYSVWNTKNQINKNTIPSI